MSELEPRIHLEKPNDRSEQPSQSEVPNFKKTAEKISTLKIAEERDRCADFLVDHGYDPDANNIQILQGYAQAAHEFFPDFCLYDLTVSQLTNLFGKSQETSKKGHRLSEQQENELNQAKSVENLVDQLLSEGIPNTQIIERLLTAHRAGEIVLPQQQFQRYQQLLYTLTDNSLGPETKIVAQIIDDSSVDLTDHDAFDQIISEVLESDKLSERAKEILREKFELKPIVLGEDLRDNLIMQQARNAKISVEISTLSDQITELEDLIEALKRRIKQLEKTIKREVDVSKRWQLEKELEEQESLRETLVKKRKKHTSHRESFKEIPTSNAVYVRGCETRISENHIEIRIPGEDRHLRFPLTSTSELVAEQVNTFLLYRVFEKYGIAANFFGNFDWTNRLLLLPNATNRANKLLHFLDMPGEAHLLTDRKLKKLDKLMNRLMKPKNYDAKLSIEENGRKRLEKLGVWPVSDSTINKTIAKLRWLQYFQLYY